jgi:uncharacterized protein YutE (UPF0331/DUF86 family)
LEFSSQAGLTLAPDQGTREPQSDETKLKELCERIFNAETAEKVRALLAGPNGTPAPPA